MHFLHFFLLELPHSSVSIIDYNKKKKKPRNSYRDSDNVPHLALHPLLHAMEDAAIHNYPLISVQ